jgi:uncharacterized protein (TIGR03437 family)
MNCRVTVELLLSSCLLCQAQSNILTANYDNSRSNANLGETQLTPGAVSPATFGKLGGLPVDGQVYGQPLYVSQVTTPDGATHNAIYVATEHNSVYAYDADSINPPVLLWHDYLGPSVPSTALAPNYRDITPEVGILSTGAIDPVNGVWYVVADTLASGAPSFQVHALDLATGVERMNGPVTVTASFPGSAPDSVSDGTAPMVPFNPAAHIQRPGLLFLNGGLYVAFGSHGDEGVWHGWLLRYNAADLGQPPAVFNTTPNGIGGSIWESGRGLAADDAGNIYAVTGNGDYDGINNFAESILKFSPALSLLDWYTSADNQYLSDNDYDMSAGPALIAGTHQVVGGDKNGSVYLVNGDAMGHLDTAGTAQVFPGVTYFGVYTMALSPQAKGTYLYLQQLAGPLYCYEYANGAFNPTPISSSTTSPLTAFSGLAVSANGSQAGTAIVWETTGNYTQPGSAGTLHAFDAGNLGTELWNSDMNPADSLGNFVKFVSPTVANGKVYVPTLSQSVAVYGLLSSVQTSSQSAAAIAAVSNAASYNEAGIAPGEIVTLFGANLGPASAATLQLDASGKVATTLAATQVLFGGIPAPMIYAGPTQVSAVVPFEVTGSTSLVQVQYQNHLSASFSMPVLPAAPGIISANSSGTGQALALNQDGTLNSTNSPAPAGSVVVFYATGGGQMTPSGVDGAVTGTANPSAPIQPVTVQIGGRNAPVLYASSAPGMVAGVLQVNAQVPADVPAGPAVPIILQVGNQPSQPGLTVAIGN